MRTPWLVLVLTAAAPARADVGACELSLDLHGAVVDGWLTERVTDPTSVDEVTLPAGARLIDVRAGAGGAHAVAVPSPYPQEPASDAVGADPAIATALAPDDQGRPRFRVVVAPIAAGHDLPLALHFTALAELRGGALRITMPARPCHGTVRVTPGPGATLARLTVAGEPTRGTFELAGGDAEVVAALSYRKPLAWTQVEPLGEGLVARATTLAAPPVRASGARRVLLVVDGSRSMLLVGAPAVTEVVRAIGAALPAHAEVEAVIFDRTPARVLGAWTPAGTATLARIEEAVRAHVPGNGSDAAAALTLAHNLLAGTPGEAMVIVITDGVFGGVADDALVRAVAASELAVDVHTIALDRGRLRAHDTGAIEATVARYGGSFVEASADHLDTALAEVDTWLRPSAQVGDRRLLAGTGVVELAVVPAPARGTPAPIAQLALAQLDDPARRARLARRHPAADDEHALAVLATTGTVARARRDAVAGGGPFVRTVAAPDPAFPPPSLRRAVATAADSAIDHAILDRLFQLQLQPGAYHCYQKALARAPQLSGTVVFHLELARGEVTRATVDGLGDAAFDACLVDAAYAIAPPLPDPSYNADDRTLASYPLTFAIRAEHPLIVAGDADSTSPLDIDAIHGGPPPRHIEAGDTTTPLGGLRPSRSP